jgi:hypothetical protein
MSYVTAMMRVLLYISIGIVRLMMRQANRHMSTEGFIRWLYGKIFTKKFYQTLMHAMDIHLSRSVLPNQIVQIGYRMYIPKYPKNAM